ncbi:WhiB family transcriptional regulator [Angustibacter sp. McL0619]|uniref:WhiB family transcriptional regulator n=1 Tax=Angustibacter sp. McL0619 TaxID=3415676 RepID=UPI003CF0D813
MDVFFRADDESAREWAPREAAALAVCAACPVRAWCLAEALALEDVEGVRGGRTGAERLELLSAHDVLAGDGPKSEATAA